MYYAAIPTLYHCPGMPILMLPAYSLIERNILETMRSIIMKCGVAVDVLFCGICHVAPA